MGIKARLARPDETLDPVFEIATPVGFADRSFPAVAGGAGSWLAAWEHDRNDLSSIDIHGRLIGYKVFLPAAIK